jgi:hypothetical protein
LDGALVGAGSLRPMLITREANFRSTYGEFWGWRRPWASQQT